MQEQFNIIDCYNKTAENYAEKFINELDYKNFDRIILKAFGEQNKDKGKIIDLGCGPGQTTKFLYENGIQNIIGTDLSTEMIKVALKYNPKIEFEQADLLQLKYSDNSFGSAIAFYSIVNFDYEQVKKVLQEVKRILINDGELLLGFHLGNEIIELNNFLDKEVNIKFQLFEMDKLIEIIQQEGYKIIDILKRHPYKQEHQTERGYIWLKK